MTREELEKKVIECVATSYKKEADTLSVNTNFKTDLGGASIQMVGLAALLENELDVMILLPSIAACGTVKDLVDLVEAEL